MVKETAVRQYPEVGEVFELEFDADSHDNTPLGMAKAFGYAPGIWRFAGKPLTGRLKGKFMLVQIGYQPNLDAAKAALEAEYGPTPKGQWIKAFNDTYPQSDGEGPIKVADASWLFLGDGAHFPYVGSDGKPYFGFTSHNLLEDCRWLVVVPEGE